MSNINEIVKPENMTNEEWFAIDLNDQLLSAC